MKLSAKSELPESPKEDTPSLRERFRVFWRDVLEGPGRKGTLLVTVVTLVFTLGVAWLLMPSSRGPAVYYSEDELGHFSIGVVKADRDYSIPDEETTAKKRAEARGEVRKVYDHDATLGERSARRVEEAFVAMRAVQAAYETELAASQPLLQEVPDPAADKPKPTEGAVGPSKQKRPIKAKGRSNPPAKEITAKAVAGAGASDTVANPPDLLLDKAELARRFRQAKGQFQEPLQVVVDDAEFDSLIEDRFSIQAQNALASLVREGLSSLVIGDRALLSSVRTKGLVLRKLPEKDPRNDRILSDNEVVAAFTDVAAVRKKIAILKLQALAHPAPNLTRVLRRLGRRLISPNVSYNVEETQARAERAAASIKPVVIQIARGEKIIGDGERIEARHLLIFKGMREDSTTAHTPRLFAGAALLTLLFSFALFSFASGSVWRFRPSRKDLLFLVTTLLATLVASKGGLFLMSALADRFPQVHESAFYFAIPLAAAPIIVRLVLSGEVTLVFTIILSVFAGLLTDSSLAMGIFVLVNGTIGADMVRRAKDRSSIWRAGMVLGLIGSVVAMALFLMHEDLSVQEGAVAAAAAASNFVTVPFTVLGLTWLVENLFGYTTDFKLLELANVNNRLLKELVVAAPGTYQHSMVIGSLVEPAAEVIGANPLLARVGAYYHDIGKGRNPRYFAENQRGVNPHDDLTSNMSTLIIRRHVSDGIKMGREAGLPSQIVDMIPMHHGTRLMAFFWHKAKEEAEAKGETPPEEIAYRHMGPKPRFREAALLMIADSVEAASRTITEPNRDRFLGLIQKVINNCFADGQFDECDITLKDLHAVARNFAGSLEAIYHSRPEYQQPADKSAAKEVTKGAAKEAIKGAGKEAAASGVDSSANASKDSPGRKKEEKVGKRSATPPKGSKVRQGGATAAKEKQALPDKAQTHEVETSAADEVSPEQASEAPVPADMEGIEEEGEALKRLGSQSG